MARSDFHVIQKSTFELQRIMAIAIDLQKQLPKQYSSCFKLKAVDFPAKSNIFAREMPSAQFSIINKSHAINLKSNLHMQPSGQWRREEFRNYYST